MEEKVLHGKKIGMLARLIIIGAGLCMMIPSDLFSLIGLVVLIAMGLWQRSRNNKLGAVA